jgi:hypothetical protein
MCTVRVMANMQAGCAYLEWEFVLWVAVCGVLQSACAVLNNVMNVGSSAGMQLGTGDKETHEKDRTAARCTPEVHIVLHVQGAHE